jgi:hypothetical protein
MTEADRELIDRWLDGELPSDEEVRLASRLEADSEAVSYLARRAHLHGALRQAVQRSALQQKALAMVEFPPSRERHDLAALPQRRWRPTKASWAAAVSLAVLMVGSSVMWLGQAKASPSDLVRQALGAHSATLDRCYRVEIRAESGRREAAGAGLPAQPETLLWTRGDRFWNQIRVGEQLVAWGRDEQGGVWFTLSPEAGARLAREEVPEPLALACELRSLELESLLRSILADFDLRRDPASGGGDLIHAELKEGRTHPRYRSALLELDAQSHVLRRVVLHRAHNGRAVAAVEFTLIKTTLNDDASYTLAGHLAPDAAIYDRQSGHGQRGRLINQFLRFVRVRPGSDARISPER